MSVEVSNDVTKTIVNMTSDILDRVQFVRFMDKKLSLLNEVVSDIAKRSGVQADTLDDHVDRLANLSQHEAEVTHQVDENFKRIENVSNANVVNAEKAGLINEHLSREFNINNNKNVMNNEKVNKYGKAVDSTIDNMIKTVHEINDHIDVVENDNSTKELAKSAQALHDEFTKMTKIADEQYEEDNKKVQSIINATNDLLIIINSYAKALTNVEKQGAQLGRKLEALSTALLDVAPEKYAQEDSDIMSLFDKFSEQDFVPKEEPKVITTNDGADRHETVLDEPKANKKHRWMFWK